MMREAFQPPPHAPIRTKMPRVRDEHVSRTRRRPRNRRLFRMWRNVLRVRRNVGGIGKTRRMNLFGSFLRRRFSR